MDLERLGAACRARGVALCVDAIQSLGALPFDVEAVQADFVMADSHKGMLGPEGLALLWVRPARRKHLTLYQYGWHMMSQGGYDFDAISGSRPTTRAASSAVVRICWARVAWRQACRCLRNKASSGCMVICWRAAAT